MESYFYYIYNIVNQPILLYEDLQNDRTYFDCLFRVIESSGSKN
jgi:hypothetical protein